MRRALGERELRERNRALIETIVRHRRKDEITARLLSIAALVALVVGSCLIASVA